MNIETVRDNIKNTIHGKQLILNTLEDNGKEGYTILKSMLEINIGELERILTDVELCMNDKDANSWTEYLNPVTGEP